MLEVGTKAPDFTLPDKDGTPSPVGLFGQEGGPVFLSPGQHPGCTRQACAFGAAYGQFQALGGGGHRVSKDSVASHQKFAAKHDLPFLLLADPRPR